VETRFRRFIWRWGAAIATVALAASCARFTATTSGSVERMYVFDCGEIAIKDISHWSPGVNSGQPFEFSNNCYLIRHAEGWMLWDSGYSDAVAARPEGVASPSGLNVGRMPRTLASQLAEIGLTPSQITHLAFSHMHNDHVGNANLFGRATLYIQETEYGAAFGPGLAKFSFDVTTYETLRDNPVTKLRGDHDVFGDGSVMIISTPGHTPGHQSLFVRLPRRGPVILSGDLVHFHDNWDHRRVPAFNYNREQSVASMEKVAELLASQEAELWINHDRAQSARIPKSPQYIE
jgi:glyoxylase-like metal-dependent hydrolase (beta-lactamase superfamily II)